MSKHNESDRLAESSSILTGLQPFGDLLYPGFHVLVRYIMMGISIRLMIKQKIPFDWQI